MTRLYKVILLQLILGLFAIHGNATLVENGENMTTREPSNKEGGLSKEIIAAVIGATLTTFIVVFIAIYMVREYRRMQDSHDVLPTLNSKTDGNLPDHEATQENQALEVL